MITKDRQYRNFNFALQEKTEDGKMIITGNPVVFNRETVIYEYDGVQYKEIIDSQAFDGADMSDVVLNIDHKGKPAAKTKNNTLILDKRIDGLYIEADLSQNATGRELYEDIQHKFYEKMSFAFTVDDDRYDQNTHTRTILKIKRLFDVSAVTFPAYSETSISARSWAEAQCKIEVAEAMAAEDAERKAEAFQLAILKLKAKILGGI